jgi:hypothetical protein
MHRSNIPEKFTGSVLGNKKTQPPQIHFFHTLPIFKRYTTSSMHKKPVLVQRAKPLNLKGL